MTPFLPFLILLLGVGAMFIGPLLPRTRSEVIGLVPALTASLALLAGLALGFRLPAEFTISAWPEATFGVGLVLFTDRIAWLFQLALLAIAAAVFLTSLSRPGGPRLGPRTASLLITAAAIVAVQTQNLITLAVAWATLDAVLFISLLLLARGENIESQATLGLTFNSLSTFCVVAAALDGLNGGLISLTISPGALSGRAVLLLLFAVIFRLGVFPFHLGLPGAVNIPQGLGTLLRLAPAAAAFDLLTHLVVVSPDLPLKPWLTAAACIGLLVGAVQLWETGDPRQGISYLILAQSSLTLLAALWGGPAAGLGVIAVGLGTLLGGAILYLSNGYAESERLWSIPTFMGVFVLAGGPLTIGYIGGAAMYSGFLASGAWGLFLLCVIGQVLLLAAYIRLATFPGEPRLKAEPILGVAYIFGLGGLLLFALVGGFTVVGLAQAVNTEPVDLFSASSLSGLGAVVVAALGGLALWRFQALLRTRAQSARTLITTIARLDWLYAGFWEIYRLVGRMLRTTADIIEGEGGVLWTIVAALLVWLLFRN